MFNIWTSNYDTSNSLLTASTAYTLLFEYDHVRYDDEKNLRPTNLKIDLKRFGCHDYQFQVWRYSGQSRHLVYALCTFIMVLCYHFVIINHLTEAVDLENQEKEMWTIYQYKNELIRPDPRSVE